MWRVRWCRVSIPVSRRVAGAGGRDDDWSGWVGDGDGGVGGVGSGRGECEELGRRCVGIEIDPGYCGIIIKRWEDMTAEKATRVAG